MDSVIKQPDATKPGMSKNSESARQTHKVKTDGKAQNTTNAQMSNVNGTQQYTEPDSVTEQSLNSEQPLDIGSDQVLMGSSISGLVSGNSAQEASHDIVGEKGALGQDKTIPAVESSRQITSEASETKDAELSAASSNQEQPCCDRRKTSEPNQENDNQVAEKLSTNGCDHKEEIRQVRPRNFASRKPVPDRLKIDPTHGNKDTDETGSSPPKHSLNSSKSLKSAERPASACVNWDEIDWESLGADSDPLNISPDSLMNKKKQGPNKPLADPNGTTEISNEQNKTAPIGTQQNSGKDDKGKTTSSESASNILENSGTLGQSVSNLLEENATFGDKELDTPAAAINTDEGDHGDPTNKEDSPIGSSQETETKSREKPATCTEPNQSNNEDMSHSTRPPGYAPAGETVGSEKHQYSADRPASARIDWNRTDWEALDTSSNPFSLSNNVEKSKPAEQLEQSVTGHAESVTRPVENSATEETESILAKTESKVKATDGTLTEISGTTEHARSEKHCDIRNVSSAEHFEQSLAEKDKVKIDSELALESAPEVDTSRPERDTDQRSKLPRDEYKVDLKNVGNLSDPIGNKVVSAEPKTLKHEANTLESEKSSDLENTVTTESNIQRTDTQTVPVEDQEQKNEDHPSENLACGEPKDVSTSHTTNESLEQTALSPPLPGGEYKIDFDNLDEYSDPFGGKITNKAAKPSAPKSNDPGSESKDWQTDKASGSSEMGNAPEAEKMQDIKENLTTENPVQEKSNTGSTNDSEKSEEQTVVSPPLPRGEYKLDFDDLDEYSDPFGGKVTNTKAKPSVPEPKDIDEETKSPRDGKSSKSSKVETAPEGKAKQPNTNKRKSENPMQEKINTASTNDLQKSNEQEELSPPLPRGEYKLDFDNLDEYSDPFGGKVTNTMTRPSVPKPKDVGEETKPPRDDESSKPSKVQSDPNGKAKQPNTKNPKTKTESAVQEKSNTASTNVAEKPEEQTELSPPLPRGEYKLDFDNLDEYSDPFGGKVANTMTGRKPKDVGEEKKPPQNDKSSKSAKVESAPKGKAKQPNTKNPKSEAPVKSQSNAASPTGVEKSEEQTLVSPPLPRGEYKLDFDNLDEYSDPFGGMVTNAMTGRKPKDVGEETKPPEDDKSSKSAKVEIAPKGKAKPPNSKNSKTETAESAMQEKSNKTSTTGVEKSEEQTVMSPPLPRGEYKIDFDNLDEYSDPFGGKVTNTKTKPSVPKPNDVEEGTEVKRDDKSSKSTKVEGTPKGKAKQPNTTKRTPELLATNTTGSSPKERLENEAMDDRPLKGGGAYNIDWDAANEMADPFGKEFQTAPTKAPVKVDSKGDCPTDSPNAVIRSPAKSGFKPATPVRTSSVPKPPSDQSSPMQNGTGPEANSTGNSSAQNGFSHEGEDLTSKPTPNSAPSPEELAEALEQAALSGNTAPINPDWRDATHVSEPSDTSYTQPTPGDQAVHPNQVLTKIDSSTRPASPAQPLLHRPSMDDELDNSARFDTPVTESEVIALRKERDELVKTIDEMQRCIAEYDRSLQHMIAEKSQGQAQVSVSVADLISERDQAVEEVATIEKAFGDLHRRFEKSKQVIEGFKQNEEALKRSIEEYKNLLQRQETKYLALKKHAEEKLLKVTQDTEAAKQEAESNATRLQASLRMMEVQVKGLEAQLEQKKRENAELTKICEELLSKYSTGAP